MIPPEQSVVLYTDGSLINGKSGGGIHYEQNNINIPISRGKFSSIFQAETMAIIESCYNI